jgi:hypothetical protein
VWIIVATVCLATSCTSPSPSATIARPVRPSPAASLPIWPRGAYACSTRAVCGPKARDRTQASPQGSTSLTPADPLKADFRNFLWAVWRHLGLPEPTPVQYDIAHFLQHGPRRLVIEAFRGVGKSWITVAFVCWLLYCDPQLKIVVVCRPRRPRPTSSRPSPSSSSATCPCFLGPIQSST